MSARTLKHEGKFCSGDMIQWNDHRQHRWFCFTFPGCLSPRSNRFLRPTSPIYSYIPQRFISIQDKVRNGTVSQQAIRDLKSSGICKANLCYLEHSPGVSSPAPWPEEPYRLTSAIYDQLVHATRAQGGSYSLCNHLAGTDVTYKLGDALGAISPLFQQDNWCGLEKKEQQTAFNNHLLQ